MRMRAFTVLFGRTAQRRLLFKKKRLEMGVISSVSEFNFGCLNSLGLENEENPFPSICIAKRRDKRRIDQSLLKDTSAFKKSRNSKKFHKSKKNSVLAVTEGETYGPGAF